MHKPSVLLTGLAAVIFCTGARADCRLELELMSADLHGVKLTERQSHELAALVDEVLKRCRMGWEDSAMQYITKARAVAGIAKRDELEWDLKPTAPRPEGRDR